MLLGLGSLLVDVRLMIDLVGCSVTKRTELPFRDIKIQECGDVLATLESVVC